jgi:hypothetical protein
MNVGAVDDGQHRILSRFLFVGVTRYGNQGCAGEAERQGGENSHKTILELRKVDGAEHGWPVSGSILHIDRPGTSVVAFGEQYVIGG